MEVTGKRMRFDKKSGKSTDAEPTEKPENVSYNYLKAFKAMKHLLNHLF